MKTMPSIVLFVSVFFAAIVNAQESQITAFYATNTSWMSSTQQCFGLDWTVSDTNCHCGIRFSDSLEGPWIDLFFSNCWNTVVSGTNATRLTPPLELDAAFFQVVASRDDLGYPTLRTRIRVCNQSTSDVLNIVLGLRAATGAQHAVYFPDTSAGGSTPYQQFQFETTNGLINPDFLRLEGAYDQAGANKTVSCMLGGFRNDLIILDNGYTNYPPIETVIAPAFGW